MESSGWVRLGRLVRAERSQRWRTRDDFAAAVGVSPRVLDDLETGRRSTFSPETLSAVEGALGWAHGTCERVVAGGQVVREVSSSGAYAIASCDGEAS